MNLGFIYSSPYGSYNEYLCLLGLGFAFHEDAHIRAGLSFEEERIGLQLKVLDFW